MAKLTLENGLVLEATVDEFIEMGLRVDDGDDETVIEGSPQVGDKIRIVNAFYTGGHYENGDVLTVCEVDSDGDVRVDFGYRPTKIIIPREFEIIARCDSTRLEKPALKVGDYVKTLSVSKYGSVSAGEIGQITEIGDVEGYIVEPYKNRSIDGVFYENQLTPATDEEITQAKAEAEREAEWTSIGRKVNEYKTGDIVRDKDFGIVEVEEFHAPGYINAERGMSLTCGKWTFTHHCELITPVEQRFDK